MGGGGRVSAVGLDPSPRLLQAAALHPPRYRAIHSPNLKQKGCTEFPQEPGQGLFLEKVLWFETLKVTAFRIIS